VTRTGEAAAALGFGLLVVALGRFVSRSDVHACPRSKNSDPGKSVSNGNGRQSFRSFPYRGMGTARLRSISIREPKRLGFGCTTGSGIMTSGSFPIRALATFSKRLPVRQHLQPFLRNARTTVYRSGDLTGHRTDRRTKTQAVLARTAVAKEARKRFDVRHP
jgi:hypothetical protein